MQNQQFVYENIVDNRKGLRQMRQWEKRVQSHQNKIAKIEAQTEEKIRKETVKTSAVKAKAKDKEQSDALKAAAKADALRVKEQAKVKKFEAWKLSQFRSATFEKLSLEQKMQLKRVLSAKGAEDQIRAEYLKTTALMRRENTRKSAASRKANRIGGATRAAATGGASGGMMALAGNPYLLAGAAVVGGGAMALHSGAVQQRETARGADLVGMDYNEFAKLASGIMATTEISDVNGVADKLKDINDRAGESIAETTYNAKTRQYEGGEGSILANRLLKAGMITSNKDSLDALFSQSPDKLLADMLKLSQGMDSKEKAFVFEAFGSDLSNLISGLANTEAFKKGQDNAVTFDTDQLKAASDFNLSIASMMSAIGNTDVSMFKAFSQHLSPETLAMFGKIGESIGHLASTLGSVLGGALNLISPAINLFLDGLNGLLEPLSKVAEWLASVTKEISNTFGIVTGFIRESIKGMVNDIANALPSWAKSLLGIESTPDTTTPDTTAPKPTGTRRGMTTGYSAYTTPLHQGYNAYNYAGANAGQQPNIEVNPTVDNRITIEMDGEKVAEKVFKTESANSSMGRKARRLQGVAY